MSDRIPRSRRRLYYELGRAQERNRLLLWSLRILGPVTVALFLLTVAGDAESAAELLARVILR